MSRTANSPRISVWERLAHATVAAVAKIRRHRYLTSWLAIGVILALGATYLMVGALRINPTAPSIHIRVHLAESGGLMPNQDVTLRGVPIGRVESVAADSDGVSATLTLSRAAKVPTTSDVQVSGLSAAGEQYLDFRPHDPSGPYLIDGNTVDRRQTSVPLSLTQFLTDYNAVLDQVDPQKLQAITRELGVSRAGADKLTAIIDGGAFLLGTLDSVLPQTVSLLKNSRLVLTTLSDVQPGMAAISPNLRHLLTGVAAMDGGYRTLLANAPSAFTSIDRLVDDNSDTMVQLLGNLATVAPLSSVRVPALYKLFTNERGSAVEALGTTIHDGAIWGIGDIYPRYSCDYSTPRQPPSNADYPAPYLYTSYCSNPDPVVLIRGARNAPRPPGDDTANPPTGVDPLQRADPIPQGRYKIPTPYGGPQLPIEPPPPVG